MKKYRVNLSRGSISFILSEAVMKLRQTRIIIIARFRKLVADDYLCKQFRSRSGRTFCRACFGSKPVVLRDTFLKVSELNATLTDYRRKIGSRGRDTEH